jgi:hypothetical protein
VPGKAGLALLEAVIDSLAPHLPPEVATVRGRVPVGRLTEVWAVPAGVGDVTGYGPYEIKAGPTGGSFRTRGSISPFGIGTWVPFVPRSTIRRWVVIDAAELVIDAVHDIVATWPAPDAVVKARADGEDVSLWFEDPAGRRIFPVAVIRSMSRFES